MPRKIKLNSLAGSQADSAKRVKNIPNWATWNEAQAQQWIDDNLLTLVDARTALKAMSRMLIALRDAQFPNLDNE